MGRGVAYVAVAGLLAAMLASGSGASGATPAVAGPVDELGASRDQLEGARRELSELEASVRRTNDAVAALDVQLTSAATLLVEVTGELDHARDLAAIATAAERRAAADLAAADATLTVSLDDWRRTRGRLADRAVHTFKHGGLSSHDLLVRGVAGAEDFHEVAVTLEAVGRLTARDRDLVDDNVRLTRSSAQMRAEVAELRTTSVAAVRAAAGETARVERLVARQQQVVEEVSRARDDRAAVLAELEADASARAVLVRDLQRRVAALEFAASRVLVSIDVDLDPFGPPPAWAQGLPGDGVRWGAAIAASAARHGIDGRLLGALVWTESNVRPDAVSHAGALGLAQLMPGTARGLGVDPRDPLANLDGGARYLRSQLDRFGRIDLALAAYNAGPGRVQRAGGIPDIVETQLYVVRVLERYGQLGG